jgi:hypothetical protein
MASQHQHQAKITATELKTGEKTTGISNLRPQGERPQYTNESAIETRVIDNLSPS